MAYRALSPPRLDRYPSPQLAGRRRRHSTAFEEFRLRRPDSPPSTPSSSSITPGIESVPALTPDRGSSSSPTNSARSPHYITLEGEQEEHEEVTLPATQPLNQDYLFNSRFSFSSSSYSSTKSSSSSDESDESSEEEEDDDDNEEGGGHLSCDYSDYSDDDNNDDTDEDDDEEDDDEIQEKEEKEEYEEETTELDLHDLDIEYDADNEEIQDAHGKNETKTFSGGLGMAEEGAGGWGGYRGSGSGGEDIMVLAAQEIDVDEVDEVDQVYEEYYYDEEEEEEEGESEDDLSIDSSVEWSLRSHRLFRRPRFWKNLLKCGGMVKRLGKLKGKFKRAAGKGLKKILRNRHQGGGDLPNRRHEVDGDVHHRHQHDAAPHHRHEGGGAASHLRHQVDGDGFPHRHQADAVPHHHHEVHGNAPAHRHQYDETAVRRGGRKYSLIPSDDSSHSTPPQFPSSFSFFSPPPILSSSSSSSSPSRWNEEDGGRGMNWNFPHHEGFKKSLPSNDIPDWASYEAGEDIISVRRP